MTVISCGAVEALGVPHPMPYLAGKTAEDFRRGVNFAVGGSTALGPEFFESRGLNHLVPVSLGNQTSWSKKVMQLLGSVHGKYFTDCSVYQHIYLCVIP